MNVLHVVLIDLLFGERVCEAVYGPCRCLPMTCILWAVTGFWERAKSFPRYTTSSSRFGDMPSLLFYPPFASFVRERFWLACLCKLVSQQELGISNCNGIVLNVQVPYFPVCRNPGDHELDSLYINFNLCERAYASTLSFQWNYCMAALLFAPPISHRQDIEAETSLVYIW